MQMSLGLVIDRVAEPAYGALEHLLCCLLGWQHRAVHLQRTTPSRDTELCTSAMPTPAVRLHPAKPSQPLYIGAEACIGRLAFRGKDTVE
jgi:hypothetical protein